MHTLKDLLMMFQSSILDPYVERLEKRSAKFKSKEMTIDETERYLTGIENMSMMSDMVGAARAIDNSVRELMENNKEFDIFDKDGNMDNHLFDEQREVLEQFYKSIKVYYNGKDNKV